MTSAFANLRPSERRLVLVVGVILFIVINYVWIVPHFSDWGTVTTRRESAKWKVETYQKEIDKKPIYEKQVRELEGAGISVPLEDMAVTFARTIQAQAAQSRISILANSRPSVSTNQFFIDQIQTITVQGQEKNLVDFLYNLGEGTSLVRVRGLSIHPDAPRQMLAANVTLVASYQKNPQAARAAAAKPAATPAPEAAAAPTPTPTAPTVPKLNPPTRPSTNSLKPATTRVVPVKK